MFMGFFRLMCLSTWFVILVRVKASIAPNDPSSATAATRRGDGNRDGPPPFAAAHGWTEPLRGRTIRSLFSQWSHFIREVALSPRHPSPRMKLNYPSITQFQQL